jgi:Tol biopolymer transport system component
MLALLVAATVAVYVGSRPRLPAPFGPAANGLVAYSSSGDIYTVDPSSGRRDPVIPGPFEDDAPRYSLDGTRLAFFRRDGAGIRVVTANSDGSNQVVHTEQLAQADSDSVAWSHDGRSLAVVAGPDWFRTVHIIDTVAQTVEGLRENYSGLEVYWRPPDGRQLMYLGEDRDGPGLFLYSLDDKNISRLPVPPREGELRPAGWTPDGRRFAFSREEADGRFLTHIVDVVTGTGTVLDIGFGRLSHDGTRVVGYGGIPDEPFLCVTSAAGGPCDRIGQGLPLPEPDATAFLGWSPDDEWILSSPPGADSPVIIDPDGETLEQPSWLGEGGESWQRVAP